MTDKKTTKTEKPAVKKLPTELTDDQLDGVRGAALSKATTERAGARSDDDEIPDDVAVIYFELNNSD